MSITLTVHAPSAPGESTTSPRALGSICLDAPRIVLGRGEGCDLRLVDRSVSARHATLRQRGRDWVLVDEGSTNGTRMGKRRLSPHAPEPLRSGDRIRLGRVVVGVELGPSLPERAPAARARALALEAAVALAAVDGDDVRPRLSVEDGVDAGRSCVLEEGRPVVVGRSQNAELALDDEAASRRHAEITLRAGSVYVRDLGSRTGSTLAGLALDTREVQWRPGEELTLGHTRIVLELPSLEALAELERAPDERVPAAELELRDPEPVPEVTELEDDDDFGPSEVEGVHEALAAEEARYEAELPANTRVGTKPAKRGSMWGATDFAVVLLALGVFSLSAVGYAVLLR